MRLPIEFRRMVRVIGLLSLATIANLNQAEAGRVTGTVVDHEGKPASGAKVWVAKLGFMDTLQKKEAVANDSGGYSIEVGDGEWVVYALRGQEGGRADWSSVAKIEEGKDSKPIKVRLRVASLLKGRLLDAETGKPVPAGTFATDDARRLAVDAQGRFEAPGLEMTNHEAYPLCPGFERRRVLFDTTGRPDAELELKLPKGGKIIGKVLDVDGKPIPGSTVGLRTSGSIFSGSALWEDCAADGSYAYDGRSLGKTGRLSARAPGYQDSERSDVMAIDPSNPSVVDFTLRLDPRKPTAGKPAAKAESRRTVSGKVIGPQGKPVAEAVVRWGLLVSSDSVPETKTDAQGAFKLDAVPDATEVLSVTSKGLAPSYPLIDAGGDRELTVEMKAGATIKGRIVDDTGAPIEGISVTPQIANPKPNWYGFVYIWENQGTTNNDGRFTLEGMPGNVACDVGGEGWSYVRQFKLSETDESKNVITLKAGGAIRGRVVDSVGKPVRNFRVQVGIPKGTKPGDPVGGYFAGYGGTGLAFTRNDGEFTISGLTAGHLHLLTVIADELGSGEADRVEATSINRLNPADALTIKLSEPHALRVRVFQAGGKIVEGARVTVIQNANQGGFQWGMSESSWDDSVTARVDDKGWAEFPTLGFGKGTVVVRAKGFARTRLDWIMNEEEFNVFLEPEARLQGTVLDEEGKPIVGSWIMLSWGKAEMMNIPIDDKDGRFQADGLGAGKFNLSITPNAGRQIHTSIVTLEPGKTVNEDIVVKRPKPAKP